MCNWRPSGLEERIASNAELVCRSQTDREKKYEVRLTGNHQNPNRDFVKLNIEIEEIQNSR